MACTCTPGGSPSSPGLSEGELVPWTRLKGSTGATTVVQPLWEVLDVSEYRAGTFVIESREFTNDVRIYLETATAPDESCWVELVNHRPTAVGRKLFAFGVGATTPLLRYLRWKVGNASGAWVAQFRVMASFKRQS